MEKKVRVCMEKRYAIRAFVVFAIFTAFIFWLTATREMKPFLQWSCLLGVVLFVWENAYWADCSKNEICVTRLGIFKRRISAERISSIHLAAQRNKHQTKLYVVICLNGHQACNFENLIAPVWLTRWYLSSKVIVIHILECQYKEYIQKLTKLYGNVTLDQSFRTWRKIENKKSRKKKGVLWKRK